MVGCNRAEEERDLREPLDAQDGRHAFRNEQPRLGEVGLATLDGRPVGLVRCAT